MSLRRGFKASANRISVRLRRGQGLPAQAPVDLAIVAARLQIDLVPLSSFNAELPKAFRQLAHIDTGAFSAATLPIGDSKRIIVHNDTHDCRRQRNNISHELAHVLLGHPFTLPIDASGCRNIDRDIEDEASWLGAAILISKRGRTAHRAQRLRQRNRMQHVRGKPAPAAHAHQCQRRHDPRSALRSLSRSRVRALAHQMAAGLAAKTRGNRAFWALSSAKNGTASNWRRASSRSEDPAAF